MQHAVRTRQGSKYMDVAREGEGWTPLMGWTSGERAMGRGYVTKESMQCFVRALNMRAILIMRMADRCCTAWLHSVGMAGNRPLGSLPVLDGLFKA